MKNSRLAIKLGFSAAVILGVVFSIHGQEAWQDQYDINDLPFKVEMRRLDSAAKIIKSNPRQFIYLIGYNKAGTSRKYAWNRLYMSRRYLIKKHRIKPERIKLLYGGQQDGLVMRISITGRGKGEP